MLALRSSAFGLLIALALSSTASAIDSNFYVIPVAGHVHGANDTLYQSDIAIRNFQPVALQINLVLIENGEASLDNNAGVVLRDGSTGSITVPADGSVLLADVLANQRGGGDSFGAILLGASAPFAVTSRTYTTNAGGGTVGQTVPAFRDFLESATGTTDASMPVAYIPGVVANAASRTNLGFVAAANASSLAPLVVSVCLRGLDGRLIGSARNFSIAQGLSAHVQFSSREITTEPLSIASAEVRILSGDGAVVPYASVVDNVSSDAVFLSGSFPPNRSGALSKGILQSAFQRFLDQLSGRQ